MKAESLPSYERIDRNAERMDTPYDTWAASQGVDVVKGFGVENVYEVPLKWGERMGGNGGFINLDGRGYLDDAYVCSIPPGKSLRPQRHLFEELVYILE
ncbi:MAG: ethanolamine ammonia lyase-activating protein, partial [Candidatus Binatota bacterium]